MKSLALFLLIIGLVFVIMGYMEITLNSKCDKKLIEYRFIPRNVYDDIVESDLKNRFSDIFDNRDPVYERRTLYQSNLV